MTAAAGSAARGRDQAVFALAVAVNLAVLYWPRTVGGPGLPQLDKLVHLLVFALVAWTGLRAGVPLGWLGGLLAVHAVLSEAVQHWVLAGRSGDAADVLADLGGVVIGLVGGSWAHERARRDGGPDRSPPGRGAVPR